MKVTVKLLDGSNRDYDAPVTAGRVAEDISPRLGSSAVAAVVDGQLRDLGAAIEAGTHELKILTDRDEQGLEVLRHTTAHVLAQAMVHLYGKDVQYAIGPALLDDFQYGFYYDFDLPEPIGAEELPRIEAEMKKIISRKIPLQRIELPVEEAREQMRQGGQQYKLEMIDDLVRDEHVGVISLYRQGDFTDMCLGPHLPDTGRVKAFKLLSTAGAYWRGDENNKMLTRIYGVAFFDQKSLTEHLDRLQEAKKRDHRIIGKQLGLFLISDAVGPGLPLWLPKGAVIRTELEAWLRSELLKRGYQIVYTPHIGKLQLYRTSGHYPYYKESQFPPIEMGEGDGYLLRPMNCPHHMQIYKATQHSYRDLPVRLAEFGAVYRMEQSGELNGLVRVRGFTQDDAHIICTPQQLEAELESCVELTQLVLETLGLKDYRVRLSLRDPAGEKYVGDAELWARAEANIRAVVEKLGLDYTVGIGEAVFYGPKIDFIVKDCIGRDWQLGTIQVDYNIPQRFELEYAGPDNRPHQPVMVHRAPFGSLERFIAILIEQFAGAFPLWLSPVQVAVLPVSEKFNDYAEEVTRKLREATLRVELDRTDEKVGAKIRRATLQKVPYMAIVGQREAQSETVSVRHRTAGDHGPMTIADFIATLAEEIKSKAFHPLVGENAT